MKFKTFLCNMLAKSAILLSMAGMLLTFVVSSGLIAMATAGDAATSRGMHDAGTAGGIGGFVIRLASTGGQFTAADLTALDVRPAVRIYTVAFSKDGTEWQQLRLGFYSSEPEARYAASRLEKRFPGLQVTAVTAVDRLAATTRSVAGVSAGGPTTGSEPVAAAIKVVSAAGTENRGPGRMASMFGAIGKLSPAAWFDSGAAGGKPPGGGLNEESGNGTDTQDREKFAPAVQHGAGSSKAAVGGASTPAASKPDGFDHAASGFLLEGAHAVADCSSCHLRGVFKGTPGQCSSCHGAGSRMPGQSMTADHVKVLPMCEECHTSQQWVPLVRMSHDAVTGSCSSCHDGVTAGGKSPSHIASGGDCESCHNTFSWTAAAFDHGSVVPGTCVSCHNGSIATGKKTNHVTSSNACDDCHGTAAWVPAQYPHDTVSGNCYSCHNGMTATGKNGAHISTSNTCEACHNTGFWKPVSRPDHAEVIGTCYSCHNGTTASGKLPGHIASGNTCDDCHSTVSWTTAVFDHSSVTGNCYSCHNGTTATGRNSTHIQTTSVCEDCHGTTSFNPALRVDHADVIGTCYSCHNGTTASGKLPGHIASGNTCDDCHTTNAWLPAVFDHSGVTAPCATCHNGTTATGKTPTHIQTSGQCDDCHSTLAWIPASFDHGLVTGSCSTCHNGTTATGKTPNHFITTLQCDECHGTSNWTTVIFRHGSGAYPGDHGTNPLCTDCHTGNSQVIAWPSPSYQPDCAGCHAGDYRPGEHQNASVSQNRDCAGTCHSNTPEHSVRDSNWD